MKKKMAFILAVVLLLGTLVSCKPKEKNRPEHLEALTAQGIPVEFYLDGGIMGEMVLEQGYFTYKIIDDFETVKGKFTDTLTEKKAVEKREMDTTALVEGGSYNLDFQERGFEAWIYEGTIDDKVVSIALYELPRDFSSYIEVHVFYGEDIFAIPQEDIMAEEEISGALEKVLPDETEVATDAVDPETATDAVDPEAEAQGEETPDPSGEETAPDEAVAS